MDTGLAKLLVTTEKHMGLEAKGKYVRCEDQLKDSDLNAMSWGSLMAGKIKV